MGIADPNEFVVGPGAAPAGKPPIGPVSINCGWVSKINSNYYWKCTKCNWIKSACLSERGIYI